MSRQNAVITAPLTRRPDPHRKDCWLVYFGDIHCGTIARAASTPNAIVQWKWSCGFYPGSKLGEIKHGSADAFEQARAAFLKGWQVFASTRTEADYQAWREQRDWTARKYAARDASLRSISPRQFRPNFVSDIVDWYCSSFDGFKTAYFDLFLLEKKPKSSLVMPRVVFTGQRVADASCDNDT
jgi:hypothetical protein